MTDSHNDPFAKTPNDQEPPSSEPGFHGQQQTGQPQYGQPQQGQPQYAQPSQGQPQYAQPQYAQPQYAPPYGPNPQTAKNWMGITALVLSLASIFTGITAIGGIIFGHMSIAAAKRGEADNAGMGRAGMIIGYIFTVLLILAVVGMVLFFAAVANECTGSNPADWC